MPAFACFSKYIPALYSTVTLSVTIYNIKCPHSTATTMSSPYIVSSMDYICLRDHDCIVFDLPL